MRRIVEPSACRAAGERRPRRALSVCAWAALLSCLAGCAYPPETRPAPLAGDYVSNAEALLASAPPKDRVLWEYRIAAASLRAGRFDEARTQLDAAIPLVGGIIADSRDAARARSLFHPEDTKIFIGEPYERSMAYYYRAILYWRDGQADNARACYRTGEVINSDLENRRWKNTFALLDYLDGFASSRLGADGTGDHARAQAEAGAARLPPYDPGANVLVFAEFGRGPRKIAGGRYGERLMFQVQDSPAHGARLTIGGRVLPLPAYDDLNYQATTRGGRAMDYILGNKAVFKGATDAVGNVALAGSAVAAGDIYHENGERSQGAENAALALATVGILSKITSAATEPQADTRTWENLPQRLSFAAARLPAGQYPATVEFLDSYGRSIPGETRALTIRVEGPGRDTVIFLSEL